MHYLNFVQGTHGIEALIKGMDRYGVVHSMITGVPVVKKWDSDSPVRPVYYLDTDSQAYWYSATHSGCSLSGWRCLRSIPAA